MEMKIKINLEFTVSETGLEEGMEERQKRMMAIVQKKPAIMMEVMKEVGDAMSKGFDR